MQCNTQQVNFRPVLFPVSALSLLTLSHLCKFLTDGLRGAWLMQSLRRCDTRPQCAPLVDFKEGLRSRVCRKTGPQCSPKGHSAREARFLTSRIPVCNSWSAGSKRRSLHFWLPTKQGSVLSPSIATAICTLPHCSAF